jgi:hypothetical protein
MMGTQLSFQLDLPPPPFSFPVESQRATPAKTPLSPTAPIPTIAGGEKAKARDIIAAIQTLKTIEQSKRVATKEEKAILSRFPGFGPVALSVFPNPMTGRYKNNGWQATGHLLKSALTAE